MENHARVRMDSNAIVCYMNFGVDARVCTASSFPEEHWLAF
jgi:hypothetical protein